MTEGINEKYYRGPYIIRPDEAAPAAFAELAGSPENEVTDETKAELYDYEHRLFDHVLETGITIGDVFRSRLEDETVSPKFYLDYFNEDPDGNKLARQLLRIEQPKTLTSHELEEAIIQRIRKAKTGEKVDWPDIALKSFIFYKEKAAQKIVVADENGNLDSLDVNAAFAQVCVEPQHVIEQITKLRLAKKTIKAEAKLISTGENTVPKGAFIDIYLGKINAQLAEYMPRLALIRSQAELVGDVALVKQVESLTSASYGALFGDEIKRRSFFRRLDYLRNGVGTVGGHATPWSASLVGILENRNRTEKEKTLARFTPEQFKKIKAFNLSPEQVIASISEMLDRVGLLTSDGVGEIASREEPPKDGKIRVVRNPNKSSYQYHSKSHSYRAGWSPQSLDRVLTVAAVHELEHVLQGLADDSVATKLSIAKPGVRGKRVGYLEEMGANAAQRRAEKYLFGDSGEADPVPTYLSALIKLEEGGNYSDAAKEFYKVKRQRFPADGKLSQAKEAVDRVARLLRFGTNSAPLSYAEEGVIEALTRDQKLTEGNNLSGVATCLDLVDQARLHQFGLMPKSTLAEYDILALALDVLDPYIKQALEVPEQTKG